MTDSRISAVKRLLRRPRIASGDFEWDAEEYTSGNRVTLYIRGERLFPAMAEAIERARETVHLETYRYGGDATGRMFTRLLLDAAKRGVRVRLIYDAIGSLDFDRSEETRLRNGGVQVLEYHPTAPWRPRWAWNKRDHRKILVCDGAIGFTGGMNLCDEHAPVGSGGLDWPDAHVRVEGPAAYELDRQFRAVWYKHTGRWFTSHWHPDVIPGEARVKIVGNQEIFKRLVIREAYVYALRAAQKDVAIANPYFIPDFRIRRALARTARRGVRVRVLVPGRSDVASVWHAMRASYAYLLARGVRIFEWQGPMMHAKAVVVDGAWSAVGSYNLDHRSLAHNLEINLHALDRTFAAEILERFERGLSGAKEITRESWRQRPWSDRLLEQFFSSFEYFF